MAIIVLVFSFQTNSAQASAIAPVTIEQANGNLVFEEQFFDFGDVTEGDVVKHAFTFKNKGDKKVKIKKIETSCGCTTAKGVLKEYRPDEVGEMEVTVDTKGKKGIVVKTLTLSTEGNSEPIIEISMAMNLIPSPHPKIEDIKNINTLESCKVCHLESGVGQSGVFLYHRVCAQCHGKKGAGGSAKALNSKEWQQVNDDFIRQMIRDGRIEKGMPSYVEGVTPPLTKEQVESLINYIRSLVQQ